VNYLKSINTGGRHFQDCHDRPKVCNKQTSQNVSTLRMNNLDVNLGCSMSHQSSSYLNQEEWHWLYHFAL